MLGSSSEPIPRLDVLKEELSAGLAAALAMLSEGGLPQPPAQAMRLPEPALADLLLNVVKDEAAGLEDSATHSAVVSDATEEPLGKKELPRRSKRHRAALQTSECSIEAASDLKEKRRMGRPIIYRGNPDSPHLTEDERRVIKRRIANRESAQRARDRKQEDAKAMADEQAQLREHEEAMQGHMNSVDQLYAGLLVRHKAVQVRCEAAEAAQVALQRENQRLRQQLEAGASAVFPHW